MGHRLTTCLTACCLTVLLLVPGACGDDWLRFRGLNGSGVCDDQPLPTQWNEDLNLTWQCELPGPGLSSPIIVGDYVLVTCWSGYAVDGTTAPRDDDQSNLLRWLVCVDRRTGKEVWSRSFKPVLPEYPFRATFKENGYATHSPASDGEFVYAFFGKSGVYCLNLQGEQVWHADVGNMPDHRMWGSSASPILHNDMLIVTAAPESNSIVALNKHTGEELWRYQSKSLADTHSTPILAKVDSDRTDLVISVPEEMWGLNPDTGQLRWKCDTYPASVSVCSPLFEDGVIYLLGGEEQRSMAIRGGGSGDVTATHVLWRGKAWTQMATPLLYKGFLWWVFEGSAYCADPKTGEQVSTLRLSQAVAQPGDPRNFRFGGNLSSPVIASNRLYYFSKSGHGYVIELGYAIDLGLEMVELSQNRIATDPTSCNASPAISHGALFFRSQRRLYCIAGHE